MLSERVHNPTAIFMASNQSRGKEMRLSELRGNMMIDDLKNEVLTELLTLTEDEIRELLDLFKAKYTL